MIKALLVGGPADGRRLVLREKLKYIHIPEMILDGSFYKDFRLGTIEERRPIKDHIYRHESFHPDPGSMIYFHESIENPLIALIEGYRNEDT